MSKQAVARQKLEGERQRRLSDRAYHSYEDF